MIAKEREKIFVVGKELLKPNEIPSIVVFGETLPEVWENSVLAVWEHGSNIPTEYDGKSDPDSKDSTMMLVIADPQKEPRIHLNFPDRLEGLEIYRQEVVDGVHNWKVGEKGWSYSYHDRLTNWPGIGGWENINYWAEKALDLPCVDQIDALINKLSKAPHSRRAQAITWVPPIDKDHHEPPCLQRIWCRAVQTKNDLYLLEMNTHWRSRDALKAAFMNMFAITDFQKILAEEISKVSGKKVIPGRYVDISDSYHIYGSDHGRKQDMNRFLKSIEGRTFEERTIKSDNPKVIKAFEKGNGEVERR